jgi:hypothetical protein
MRRSGSDCRGARYGSCMGSGRLLARVIVGDERDDGVRIEAGAAVEVGELYEEGDAGYDTACVFDELAHGAGGAACGEEVVGNEDAGSWRHSVGVGFQGVGAILELVGGGDGFAGELVRFSGEDEAFAGAVSEGRAEDEAASLGREDPVVFEVFREAREGVNGEVEGFTVFYEGRYVLEGDAWLGEIGDGPDVTLELARYFFSGALHVGAQGTKVSMTFAIINSFMRASTEAR